MIVSYIPAGPDGWPIISSGVERELQHAHEAAKEVFVIWMPKKKPSVSGVLVDIIETKKRKNLLDNPTGFDIVMDSMVSWQSGLLHLS